MRTCSKCGRTVANQHSIVCNCGLVFCWPWDSKKNPWSDCYDYHRHVEHGRLMNGWPWSTLYPWALLTNHPANFQEVREFCVRP